jgi:hypothetical protein
MVYYRPIHFIVVILLTLAFKPGLHLSHSVFLLQVIAKVMDKVNSTWVLSLPQHTIKYPS